MATKKEIVEEMQRLIDHWTPYRPVLETQEAVLIRAMLKNLIIFAKGRVSE